MLKNIIAHLQQRSHPALAPLWQQFITILQCTGHMGDKMINGILMELNKIPFYIYDPVTMCVGANTFFSFSLKKPQGSKGC